MQIFNDALQRAEGSGEPALDVLQFNETGIADNATLTLISDQELEDAPHPPPGVAAQPPRFLATVPKVLRRCVLAISAMRLGAGIAG